MFQPIRIGRLPAGALRSPAVLSSISLAALLGCSDDVVNLGEDASARPTPPSYSRCVDSPTLAGDVIVKEQAQLDELEGCETIDGDVFVQPFFEPDLRPLHALKVVAGGLSFSEVYPPDGPEPTNEEAELVYSLYGRWLGSFEGLEALTSVGSLTISFAAASDLAPLSGLRELTGEGGLVLSLNNVRDLAPLGRLQGIRSLVASGERLESIADLQLPSTLDSLQLWGERLTELDSLRQVRQVRGQLVLAGVGVHDLTSLSNLESVGSSFSVVQLPFLESLHGLEQLTEASDQVYVARNPLLESIEGLTTLGFTDVLWIDSNQRLRQIPDFPALQPMRALIISNNPALERIAEFSGILETYTYVLPDGEVRREPDDPRSRIYRRPDVIDISHNPALRSFTMPAGWAGGKFVEISDNASLEALDLAEFDAIDLLSITHNPSLRSVDLGVLDTVDSLSVIGNPLLSPSTFDNVRTFERNMAGNSGQPPATPEDYR